MSDDSHWDGATCYERDLDREGPRTRAPITLSPYGTLREVMSQPWASMRSDGLMAYAVDFVLDHRTCLKCRGSFSREVNATTEEALAVLRSEGLL